MNYKEGDSNMSHEQHLAELKKDWQNQLPVYEKIKQMGAEGYFVGVNNLSEAFFQKDRTVRCMDERTPGGIHCAGSGILLPREEAIAFYKQSGALGLSSHEGCGAMNIYMKQNGLVGDLDELAIRLTKELAVDAGLPYTGHLRVERDHHYARAAYYDGTGIFDWSNLLEELPPGFFVNRANFNPGYAVNTEAVTAARIAMGDHGYGNLISAENPFYFFAIGNGELPVDKLLAELKPLKQEFGDKIVIAGFNAPAEK